MKEKKSETDRITEKIQELSNDEYPGRYLVSESLDLIHEAVQRGIEIPENLKKYLTKEFHK